MYPGENCRSRRLNNSKNTVNIVIQVSAVHPSSTKHQRTHSKRKGSLVRTKYTRLQPVLGGLHRNYSRYRTHNVLFLKVITSLGYTNICYMRP